MTESEFIQKFRGRMLMFLMEAWAVRKVIPSDLGMVADQHALEVKRLLSEMYDALCPSQTKAAQSTNNLKVHHEQKRA